MQALSYASPLPTIADTKRLGVAGFRVEFPRNIATTLNGSSLARSAQAKARFVCEKCGGGEAAVGADWNQYYAALNKSRTERLNGQSP
jgi:hypothetical protein